MAKWSGQKVDVNNINDGNEYRPIDRPTRQQLNAIVNNSLYASAIAEGVSSQLSSIDPNAKIEFKGSNPNLLINGDFRVNQRGESALTVAGGKNQYTFDRWRVNTGSGVTSTLAKNEKGMSITNTGGATLSQYFEDEFLQNKGRIATLSAKINGVVYSYTAEIGTSTNKLMSDINIRFIIGTGIYNGNQEKFIRFTMYDANVTYNFEWVKFEISSIATPFVPRPYAEELALCQRFFVRFANKSSSTTILLGTMFFGQTSYCWGLLNTPVPLRTTPTIISYSNLADLSVNSGSGGTPVNLSSLSVSNSSQNVLRLYGQANGVPSNSVLALQLNSGDTYIEFDAEI